ncbi:hypothetical protein AXF42_Ash005411 [Apostasia shenzhenica]|uniref:Uncharacterized protein n=1 Tax=Apostasia shenzhenica TaxID=1088818 RepID=A0A2I0B6U3_9ASPA|nr:hypothetical protein AXF42_Ash005411 [Apostasia shenzhenica]
MGGKSLIFFSRYSHAILRQSTLFFRRRRTGSIGGLYDGDGGADGCGRRHRWVRWRRFAGGSDCSMADCVICHPNVQHRYLTLLRKCVILYSLECAVIV